MPEPKIIIQNFIKKSKEEAFSKNALVLKMSNFDTIKIDDKSTTTVQGLDWRDEVLKNYDFIFGDIPFGMDRVQINDKLKIKIPRNWKEIFDSLNLLSEKGIAFYIVEPSIIYSRQGNLFTNYLEEKGFYINSILNPPEKLFYPTTSFRPIVVGINKTSFDTYFIGEINKENFRELADSLHKRINSGNLEQGLIVGKDEFESFESFKINGQIENLKTQYKEYSKFKINEIANEINLTRDKFDKKPNSIYVPKLGTSEVSSSLDSLKVKHQNVFQVQLNESVVKADYLSLFFRSELGKLTLSSLSTGSFIPTINKSSIENCIVAIPKIEEQKLLIHTNQKLNELQDTIHNLRNELSLNPQNANVILEQFDNISSPLKELTIEDEILGLIRKGEGKQIEFKQTFSKNIRTNKKDKLIQKSTLKNIVGFLNADGGVLLVGVADEGTITGIEDDYFQSNDKYLLNFKNLLTAKIGSEFYPLIDFNIYKVFGKRVLKIDCKASDDPCFYDDIEFYVRTNPATDRLEGKKQMEYIRKRFK
ncbi:MAG: hypothetical protein GY705_00150 [Bacteroidetes bacterium]|nr:hypothetical protein [Bacteroidota bacterium]